MLKHLYIRNYALIKELDIDFEQGFSVMTGETGAGKSIILGALNLVMGARADIKAIREGEERCVIEASFESRKSKVESQKTEEVIIRRELHSSGRSRSFVNDEVVSLVELKELSARLIDIHSQHENLLLGDDLFQLGIVDAIAGNEAERAAYTTAYTDWCEATEALHRLETLAAKLQKDADYVAFQLQQLEEARLQAGELEELEEEQYRLSHAEEIGGRLEQAIAALDGDGEGVISRLKVCRIGEADSALQERIESCTIELKDILNDIERLRDRTEADPERLQEVDDRIGLIQTLLRKHDVRTVEELISLRDSLREKSGQADHIEEEIESQKVEVERRKSKVESTGKALTHSREAVRETISRQVESMCRELGIKHAKVDVSIAPLPTGNETGLDDVQILFAANLGQSLRRVSEVASGGEISRVMLSIKALIASTSGLPTIIFDEIDTGVSGEIANKMGQIMLAMGQSRQIIAISHLPQIAVQAQQQYLVYKADEADHTETHIRLMNAQERQNYIQEVYATISRAAASKDAQ